MLSQTAAQNHSRVIWQLPAYWQHPVVIEHIDDLQHKLLPQRQVVACPLHIAVALGLGNGGVKAAMDEAANVVCPQL